MKRTIVLSVVLIASPAAFAFLSAPGPEAVPVLGTWGMFALGAGVALAGVIGVIRTRKK